jgi:hypothetical protein
MDRAIDYGNLMHRAMRGLIRDVMEQIADDRPARRASFLHHAQHPPCGRR